MRLDEPGNGVPSQWYGNGMDVTLNRHRVVTTTIDKAGRLVIPKDLRRLTGLEPGATVEITREGAGLLLQAAGAERGLVQEGRFLVLAPSQDGHVLTQEDVRRWIDADRE
jgi:AbrB family looped-hinge helix DNA binding protein